jgi:hypothetical protein
MLLKRLKEEERDKDLNLMMMITWILIKHTALKAKKIDRLLLLNLKAELIPK